MKGINGATNLFVLACVTIVVLGQGKDNSEYNAKDGEKCECED